MKDTIFALSSGIVPSGISVIRISGPQSRVAIEKLAGDVPLARHASLRTLIDPSSGEMLDKAIVLWFPGPGTFTGEDCAEFQGHGGVATVSAILSTLGWLEGFRMAEPGEFTRRAFANGIIDLTEAEGLADLISAQTAEQRTLALRLHGGELRRQMEAWRTEIVRLRALIEADLDFSEEEDVPGSVADKVWLDAERLRQAIADYLDDGNRGEIVREGFQVVLLGPPNVGKSSLLNALAQRNVAIVSEEPGTTRDVLEVNLDLAGYAVTIVDTAGLREATGAVESEGIRRALDRASHADLVIWLSPADEPESEPDFGSGKPVITFRSKDDTGAFRDRGVSVLTENGLLPLIDSVTKEVRKRMKGSEAVPITRERHRQLLARAVSALSSAVAEADHGTEIRAEYLRQAGDRIGQITGQVDVEDILDVIFSEFCIGK